MNESERLGIPYAENYQYLESSDTPVSNINCNESQPSYSPEQINNDAKLLKRETPSSSSSSWQEPENKFEDAKDLTVNEEKSMKNSPKPNVISYFFRSLSI